MIESRLRLSLRRASASADDDATLSIAEVASLDADRPMPTATDASSGVVEMTELRGSLAASDESPVLTLSLRLAVADIVFTAPAAR